MSTKSDDDNRANQLNDNNDAYPRFPTRMLRNHF